jgi:hypothetical protein
LSVGILLGDDGLFDVLREFVPDSADSIPDILSANIHIAIQLKLNRDRADLFAGFASEDFDSRNIVNFLLHGFSHIGFDQFGIGARTGIFLSGDIIYDGPLIDDAYHSDVPSYVETMERLRALPVSVVHGGHFPSFGPTRFRQLIDAYVAGHRKPGCHLTTP